MADDASQGRGEFHEIAHCGGRVTFTVHTDADGRRSIQFGVEHSSPTAAAWFAVYALSQGIPVGMIELGGIGRPWNPPPVPGCLPVFIASDREGRFGHRCRRCRGYWRSRLVPTRWPMTCPYCGSQFPTHELRTNGQLRYIAEYCRIASEVFEAPDGEHVLDMDAVASASGRDVAKPKLFYAEERQQNSFRCVGCDADNDILGRYGYCCSCGTHNGLSELQQDIQQVRSRLAAHQSYEAAVKDSVAAFDSLGRQIAKQLAHRVPMTVRRRNDWKRRLFHGLGRAVADFREVFDIDLAKAIPPADLEFATLMFHRRHVYEHNGGEADDKYIQDSGDTSVRPKQLIRESQETAERLAALVLKLGGNLVTGFHSIFAPEDAALRFKRGRRR